MRQGLQASLNDIDFIKHEGRLPPIDVNSRKSISSEVNNERQSDCTHEIIISDEKNEEMNDER